MPEGGEENSTPGLLPGNPHQSAHRQPFVERHQVRRRHVNAAARLRAAERRLVAETVDVNITLMRIDVAPAVESGLQPFQPENAMDNRALRLPEPDAAITFLPN